MRDLWKRCPDMGLRRRELVRAKRLTEPSVSHVGQDKTSLADAAPHWKILEIVIGSQQFWPIYDKVRFPLLTAGFELPCAHLMGCERLTFFAPEDSAAVAPVILQQGLEWHLYGDTRWPSLSSWLEIDTSPAGFRGYSGILVTTYEIPDGEADPFAWVSDHGPLQHLFPEERGDAARSQRLEMLRQQAASSENISGPDDSTPRYIESYCIYRGPGEVRCIARYTDLLNEDGVPIPQYRIASVQPGDIQVCRFSLHALFRLNEARLAGKKFTATPQLEVFEPAWLSPGNLSPPWRDFTHYEFCERVQPLGRFRSRTI